MPDDINLDAELDHLHRATTLEEVVAIARIETRRVLGAQGVTFVVREGDNCFYVDEDAIAPLWKGQRFPLAHCISGWAMMHHETAVIPDTNDDPRIPQEAYRSTFVRSLVMAPVGREESIGAMGAYWMHTRYATPDEVATLEKITDAVAEAIERIGLADAPWAPSSAAH